MLLSVFERLILLNVLPHEGDYTTLRVLRKLQEDLSFSEEELKALQFETQESGGIRWQKAADKPVEIPIGEKAHEIIANRLRELDQAKKLTMDHMPIYERFVIGKEPAV